MKFTIWDAESIIDKKPSMFASGVIDTGEPQLSKEQLEEIGTLHTQAGFCGSTFNENRRIGTNFIQADFIVMDIESATQTVEYIKNVLKPVDYVIVSSKNHLVDKNDGKGIIERYHVIVPLKEPITDILFYNEFALHLFGRFNIDVDKSCAEVCRFLSIGKTVLAVNHTGKQISHKNFKQKPQRATVNITPVDPATLNDNIKSALEGKWWKDRVIELNTPGKRSNAVCSMAGLLKKIGADLQTATNIILDSYKGTNSKQHAQRIKQIYKYK